MFTCDVLHKKKIINGNGMVNKRIRKKPGKNNEKKTDWIRDNLLISYSLLFQLPETRCSVALKHERNICKTDI